MSIAGEPSVGEVVEMFPAGSGVVGLDLEADSLYRYQERICLIQVCFGDQAHLIDPLDESEELGPLLEWLKTAEIWMHGADYDIALMTRGFSFVPPKIFDTQIAAQLCGEEKFGYANLVQTHFDVELSKSSQKADWGKRPLSPKMLQYAKNDVLYLLPLAEKLVSKLKELGRYDWFLESCETARAKVIAREAQEKEAWRLNGSGKLSQRGLGFLKELWEWRDVEAEDWNRPSFMVATNKQLLEWATQLSKGTAIKFPTKMRTSRTRRLAAAVIRARELKPEEWPKRPARVPRRRDPDFEDKVNAGLTRRKMMAEELGIDPSVLISRSTMEELVKGEAEPSDLLMKWQREVLQECWKG